MGDADIEWRDRSRDFSQNRGSGKLRVLAQPLISLGHFLTQEATAPPATDQFFADHFATVRAGDVVGPGPFDFAMQLLFREVCAVL